MFARFKLHLGLNEPERALRCFYAMPPCMPFFVIRGTLGEAEPNVGAAIAV